MKTHVFTTNDPFKQREEMWKVERDCLVSEIIRLKIKCSEEITSEELVGGFGNPPKMFVSPGAAKRHPGVLP